MAIKKSLKKLWYKENVKHYASRSRDLKKLLNEMGKGKKVVLALDVGGKFGGLSYLLPEKEWVKRELKESQENLAEYRSKLRKVI